MSHNGKKLRRGRHVSAMCATTPPLLSDAPGRDPAATASSMGQRQAILGSRDCDTGHSWDLPCSLPQRMAISSWNYRPLSPETVSSHTHTDRR